MHQVVVPQLEGAIARWCGGAAVAPPGPPPAAAIAAATGLQAMVTGYDDISPSIGAQFAQVCLLSYVHLLVMMGLHVVHVFCQF